mmetsp:Transcript_17881/g.26496  ORF Transcript_17881/g.26496 Transcript_17881/m.26496 type:complete len:279 (-) Transcript_17881:159-995(-)
MNSVAVGGSAFSGHGDLDHNNADLRIQLLSLQESTKKALMKSWAEVEELQQENTEYLERNRVLEQELEASKRREEKLAREVESLKARLGEGVINSPTSTSSAVENGNNEGSNNKLGRFLSKGTSEKLRSDELSRSGHSIDVSMKSAPELNFWQSRRGSRDAQKLEEELLLQMKDLEEEKKRVIAEWQVKLECRDTAIHHMETATKLQHEDLEHLRMSLEDALNHNSELEHIHAKQLHAYKKKVHEKKKVIVRQADKLKEMQEYIEDITAELEKVYRKS